MRYIYIILGLLLTLHAKAVVRYVSGNGVITNNGLSWANATPSLQAAINNSVSGDEVWIRAGTYTPSGSFSMKNGVKIYGGFVGNETLLSQRNWTTNVVTLQGNNNSVISNSNLNNTALLDGVTITGGMASYGGGMYNSNASSPTITNVKFVNNRAYYDGGGMWTADGNPVLTNVHFNFNIAGYSGHTGSGGGMYNDEAYPVVTNVSFYGNSCTKDGGAVYNYNGFNLDIRKPTFINSVFSNNHADGGAGGAIFSTGGSKCIVTNCTFVFNFCSLSGCGGAIHNYNSAAQITNSLFWGNYFASTPSTLSDIITNNTNSSIIATVTYSYLKNPPAGTGNVASGTIDPFANVNDLDGPDNIYMTADDGIKVSYCSSAGSAVIDKGNSNAIATATDVAGLARKVNCGMVEDGNAGIVDIGAYEDQTTITRSQLIGSIGNEHTIPAPQELASDSVSNVTSPLAGMTISWEKSENNGSTWTAASPASSLNYYRLPALTVPESSPFIVVQYRRVVLSSAYCNTPFYSNVIAIKVVKPNGRIYGRVTNKLGTAGIPNVNVFIKRTGRKPISGTDTSKVYTAITDGAGYYSVSRIYYGDPAIENSKDTFKIFPKYLTHKFDPDTFYNKALAADNYDFTGPVDFKDTTVFTITGKTIQNCAGCLNALNYTNDTMKCELDSVQIWKNSAFDNNYSTVINGNHGRFTITTDNPGNLLIEPRFRSHKFDPSYETLNVQANVTDRIYVDTTTHVISGRVTAGCNEAIGAVTLEFKDSLPSSLYGNAGVSCFRKRITTAQNGYYSVRLPARMYKISVVDFENTAGSNSPSFIQPETFKTFINEKLRDSLFRNITDKDTILNIVYERPPVLQLTGLSNVCNQSFAIIQQGATETFKVKIFQGDPTLNSGYGCPSRDTSIITLSSSVPSQDNSNIDTSFRVDSSYSATVKLKGGAPFILGNFYKTFSLNFKDRYNRFAIGINKNIIVTGVKSDANTFTSVSPQIPFMVLHDPPGDASYSSWKSSQSVQSAMRIYTAKENSVNTWLEAKIGTKLITGIGVSTESEVWAKLGGSVGVSSANTTSNETILTTTTSTEYRTSSAPANIGSSSDLYIGGALNIVYAKGYVIKYNASNCQVSKDSMFIVAPDSIKTEYAYTEYDIRNSIIPNLQSLAGNPANSQGKRDSLLNQVSVWEQVIANNEVNKSKAAYVQNISFGGGGSGQTRSTTSSVSKSNSIEFKMAIDATIAAELGFDIAGSGLSGGVNVAFKVENGGSTTNTTLNETTIDYTLQDNSDGDLFSVDIKKDPVYNTPVFQTVGGQTSCPPEEGTVNRDNIELVIPNTVVSNVAPGADALFNFNVYHNTSLNGQQPRNYKLSFDYTSNTNGATVIISGNPTGAIDLTLPPSNTPVNVPIRIRQSSLTDTFAYEGLRFVLKDACTGDVSKEGRISAYFQNACSNVTLAVPENGWSLNNIGNNVVPILIKGYTLSSLTSISLEYSVVGTLNHNWINAFTLYPANLNTIPADGTTQNWDVQNIPDGAYNLRLRLNCSGGVTYSQRITGTIDRVAPLLFGKPEPADNNYVNGDVISFSYNEKLNTTNLNNGQVTMQRLSNNTLIPITVSGYENKIIITPNSSITNYTGDSIRVIVSGIADQYNNVRTKPDTMYFTIGNTVPATGNSALIVSVVNPRVSKNSDSTISITFKLPANTLRNMRVNYTIGGTAKMGKDYSIEYPAAPASYAFYNGAQGAIRIDSATNQATIRIKPIGDTALTADKTIIINISEGGDYGLGSTTSVTATITSEDGIYLYSFIGNGNFSDKTQWLNGKMPLTTLAPGKTIIIDPSGTCNLNVPLTLKPTSTLRVMSGKQFIIPNHLKAN